MTMIEQAVALEKKGYSRSEIARMMMTTKGSVSGMLWRAKKVGIVPPEGKRPVDIPGTKAWWKARGF